MFHFFIGYINFKGWGIFTNNEVIIWFCFTIKCELIIFINRMNSWEGFKMKNFTALIVSDLNKGPLCFVIVFLFRMTGNKHRYAKYDQKRMSQILFHETNTSIVYNNSVIYRSERISSHLC